MGEWIAKMFRAARQYSVWDFGALKIAVFSLGLLLGAYFPDFFLRYSAWWWLVFLLASTWVVYVTLVRYQG